MIPALANPIADVSIVMPAANDRATQEPTLSSVVILAPDSRRFGLRTTLPPPPRPPLESDVWEAAPARPSPFVARRDALLRALAVREAARSGAEADDGEVAWRIQLFRDRAGLCSAAELVGWLGREGLSFARLSGFLRATALVERLETLHAPRLERERATSEALLSLEAPGLPDGELDALLGRGEGPRAAAALVRMLGVRELQHLGESLPRSAADAFAERFRARFGLDQGSAWLTSTGLTREAFARFMADLAAVREIAGREAAEASAMEAVARAVSSAGDPLG